MVEDNIQALIMKVLDEILNDKLEEMMSRCYQSIGKQPRLEHKNEAQQGLTYS